MCLHAGSFSHKEDGVSEPPSQNSSIPPADANTKGALLLQDFLLHTG